MQTEAIFENIAIRIQEEINKAQKSIYIAVAWFTNQNIFDQLLLKAKKGCAIHLIISNDEINNNSSINFKKLNKHKGKIYKIGDGDNELMHNKFCVIDFNTVITGSYNWSYKAENNFENIVINYNDTSLAEQFINEFIQIKNKYYPIEPKIEKKIEKIKPKVVKKEVLLEKVREAVAHPDVKTGTVFIAGVTKARKYKGVQQMILEVVQKKQLKLDSNPVAIKVWMKFTVKGYDALFTNMGITGDEIYEASKDLTKEEVLMTFARVRSVNIEGDEEVPTIQVKQYSAEEGLPNKIQRILDIEESERTDEQDKELAKYEMRTKDGESVVDIYGNQVYEINELTYGEEENSFIKKMSLSDYKKKLKK